jgi:hypothetical protein
LIFFNSSTCIAIAKSIHKMHVTIFHVGKHKRHFSNSVQITYQPFTTKSQRVLHYQPKGMQFRDSVNWIAVIWHHTQGRTCVRLSDDRYSAWNPKEDHTFLWPLSS